MPKNFTQFAFTPTVKKLQEENGSRRAYERTEQSGDRFLLGVSEISFILSRNHFYLSTVGENGWPYLQHRGGEQGFLKIVDSQTLRFADYSGNRQYISAGNAVSTGKACLFLVDYPARQRLKIWAEVSIQSPEEAADFIESLRAEGVEETIERVFTLEIQAFDWNCPKHLTPRYTLEEIKNSPQLLSQLTN